MRKTPKTGRDRRAPLVATSDPDWRRDCIPHLQLEKGPVEMLVARALLVALPPEDPYDLKEEDGSRPLHEYAFVTSPENGDAGLWPARHALACYALVAWRAETNTEVERRAALVVLLGIARLTRGTPSYTIFCPPGEKKKSTLDLLTSALDAARPGDALTVLGRVVRNGLEEPNDLIFARQVNDAWVGADTEGTPAEAVGLSSTGDVLASDGVAPPAVTEQDPRTLPEAAVEEHADDLEAVTAQVPETSALTLDEGGAVLRTRVRGRTVAINLKRTRYLEQMTAILRARGECVPPLDLHTGRTRTYKAARESLLGARTSLVNALSRKGHAPLAEHFRTHIQISEGACKYAHGEFGHWTVDGLQELPLRAL